MLVDRLSVHDPPTLPFAAVFGRAFEKAPTLAAALSTAFAVTLALAFALSAHKALCLAFGRPGFGGNLGGPGEAQVA